MGGTHPHEGRSKLSLRQIGTKSLGHRAGSEWTDDPTTDQDPLLRLEETGREDSSRLYSATFPHDGQPVRMKPIGGAGLAMDKRWVLGPPLGHLHEAGLQVFPLKLVWLGCVVKLQLKES